MTATTWAQWVLLALAVLCLLVAAVVLLVTDTWRTGVATAVLGVLAVSRTGPRAGRPDPGSSERAAAGWDPQRVRQVVGDPGDRVRATRDLRRADPRLGLSDAVRLVDAAADGQQRDR